MGKKVRLRGHELDDQYRYFVMNDNVGLFEEMIPNYGAEFTKEYKKFIEEMNNPAAELRGI